MATAEQTGENAFEARINVVKDLLETCPGLAVNLANSFLECLKRRRQIFKLLLKILGALRLLIAFLDCKQIYGTDTIEPPLNLIQLILPVTLTVFFRKFALLPSQAPDRFQQIYLQCLHGEFRVRAPPCDDCLHARALH